MRTRVESERDNSKYYLNSNMVDRPLGGTKLEIDEFAQQENKPQEMPDSVEEKLLSKKWDVRAAGFEQVSGLFRGAKSQSDDCFFEHGSQLKKYL